MNMNQLLDTLYISSSMKNCVYWIFIDDTGGCKHFDDINVIRDKFGEMKVTFWYPTYNTHMELNIHIKEI